MPIGAGGVAAITAAGAVLSQGANAYATGRMNRKNRNFSKFMYDTQRADALSDWERMNQYNSPVEQMRRLKAAGLNPNLVYGDGANSPSSTIRSASFDQPNQEAPQFSNIAGETIGKYQEVTMQKQQLANMQATEKLIQAQTDATLANAGLKNINLRTEQQAEAEGLTTGERLAKYQSAQSDAEIKHQKMRSALVQAEIDEATKSDSITAAAEKITQMRITQAKTQQEKDNLTETLRILKAQGTLAELDAEFAKSMNKRWDGYLIKILGLLLGGK